MGRPRAMIVEDEFIIALSLKKMAEKVGIEVTDIASTGEKAVAKADESSPDLVFMDIKLAGPMTGIEAAATIMARRGCLVVFVSANTDEDTKRRALSVGPLAYIPKPVRESDLQELFSFEAVALLLARPGD